MKKITPREKPIQRVKKSVVIELDIWVHFMDLRATKLCNVI